MSLRRRGIFCRSRQPSEGTQASDRLSRSQPSPAAYSLRREVCRQPGTERYAPHPPQRYASPRFSRHTGGRRRSRLPPSPAAASRHAFRLPIFMRIPPSLCLPTPCRPVRRLTARRLPALHAIGRQRAGRQSRGSTPPRRGWRRQDKRRDSRQSYCVRVVCLREKREAMRHAGQRALLRATPFSSLPWRLPPPPEERRRRVSSQHACRFESRSSRPAHIIAAATRQRLRAAAVAIKRQKRMSFTHMCIAPPPARRYRAGASEGRPRHTRRTS